jgi:hypothetical protein
MGRACNTLGREGECIWDFGGKPEGKRPLGKPRSMCEGNVKTVLGEIVLGGMDWIDLF